MDDDIAKYFLSLKEINKALVTALDAAISVMQQWDDLSQERRQSIIEALQNLVAQSNKAYETDEHKH